MDINSFIEKIENEFDFIVKGTLKPETDYRELQQWGSMQALILMALIVTDYKIVVTGGEIVKCNTISELYHLVESKLKNAAI